MHENDWNLALNTKFSLQIMIESYENKFLLICMYQYVSATSAKSGTNIEMPISQLENWNPG